ncbi:MAG: glucose-6-phosphate dehydrogenase, partial [Anaerolineae bacterium]
MNNEKPVTIVIFGASGDLTQRKLIPALFNSYCKGRLPKKVHLIGFARRPWSHDDFRAVLLSGMQEYAADAWDEAVWPAFAEMIWYVQGDLNTAVDYQNLNAYLT